MLLAVDIGNTNIVIGCFDGDSLRAVMRVKTDTDRTLDEYEALFFSLLHSKFGEVPSFTKAIVSSVVPPITSVITHLLRAIVQIEPLIVGPGIKTGLAIRTQDPSAVGADRIVNSIAAKTLYGTPALVIDFGTATSFDVVNKSGDYNGGIIAPGVQVALDALVKNTAKLPRIELTWPEKIVGTSTVTAMQSGAVPAYLCMVEGLIEKIGAEVGAPKCVIATGGLGKIFHEHSKLITAYEPDLTLRGLKIITEMNHG